MFFIRIVAQRQISADLFARKIVFPKNEENRKLSDVKIIVWIPKQRY